MARVFLAGPDQASQDRRVLEALADLVAELGHTAYVPHREARLAADATPEELRRHTHNFLQHVEASDAVLAVLDGADAAPAAALAVGFAASLRRPVLGLRSDARSGAPFLGLNPRILGAVSEHRVVENWEPYTTRPILEAFLGSLRVYAGTLVRDAVPKLLEAEGQALRFRSVDAEAYPNVLKRNLVTAARRLEEAEWGAEQEEIADLLELLETLINHRAYDKETLRSIKEGKWRKRGGFERGLLLEEEPKLSSG